MVIGPRFLNACRRVAVSIVGPTEDEAHKDIDQAVKEGADLIEIRRDCFGKLDYKGLERLTKHYKEKGKEGIFTCRHKAEAGPSIKDGFQGTEDERSIFYQQAVGLCFEYIDMEHEHSFFGKGQNIQETKVIRSSHNFERTTTYENLCVLFRQMRSQEPYIVKIATMAETSRDATKILQLLDRVSSMAPERPEGGLLAMCMGGPDATETRVYGPMHGAPWVYACVGDKKAAPGQPSVESLRQIWHTLGME